MRIFACRPYFLAQRKKGLLRKPKHVFAFSLDKQSTRKTCNLCEQKGVFASQVQSVQSRKMRLLHMQEWGKSKVNKQSPIIIAHRHNHHLITMSHHPLNVHPPTPPSTSANLMRGPMIPETTVTCSRELGARLSLSSTATGGRFRPRTLAVAGPRQLQRTDGAQTPCRLA